MLLEIQIAVSFLTSYLYNKLPRRRVDLFSVELTKNLKQKFHGHWYPEKPAKGSGFRCILIGEELDPVLINAASDSGLSLDEIRRSLPEKLTMWIDPDEVSYRIEDQPVVKMIYQKDKYGEQGNLAELEGFVPTLNNNTINQQQQQQQFYSTSPQRSNSNPGNFFHSSPSQNSPVLDNSPIQNSHNYYNPWSTTRSNSEDNYTTTTNMAATPRNEASSDSRLSPNAREFTYPTTKMSSDYFYRQDTTALSSFASNLWGNSHNEVVGRQAGNFSSLQNSLAGYGWLATDTQNYKRNYNSSQLEVMA